MNPLQTVRPRTTYEAAQLYLRTYEAKYVVGDNHPEAEMHRLRDTCEAYIYFVKRVSPSFYRDQLPPFIEQVTRLIQDCDTKTPAGEAKFHEIHQYFMIILLDLKASRPVEKLDFFTEERRCREREKHLKRLDSLQDQIAEFEAVEFVQDEIGQEDEGRYNDVIHKLEKLRADFKRTALEIAYLDGEDLDYQDEFRLEVLPNQKLALLSQDQRDLLEAQLADLYKRNYNRRDAIIDKETLDRMIESVNIDHSLFKKIDIHDMACEMLLAYQTFRRKEEQEGHINYYHRLLEKEQLLPKEGTILKNPDDIPADIKARLDQNDHSSSRELERLYHDYGDKVNVEDTTGIMDQDESDEDAQFHLETIESIKQRGKEFARVKHEILDEQYEEDFDQLSLPSPSDTHTPMVDQATNPAEGNDDRMNCSGSDSDDIECLGTVEPADKVTTIVIKDLD